MKSGTWTNSEKNEFQRIIDDEKEVEETKKILTDKIEKLMKRGESLEDLESHVVDIEKEADIFKENNKKLKKEEQKAESREYSLILSWIGTGLGITYGFFAGYSWPMMLLLGAACGLSFYTITRIFTGINQTIDNTVHMMSAYFPSSLFSSQENKPKKTYLPGFELKDKLKEKLSSTVSALTPKTNRDKPTLKS